MNSDAVVLLRNRPTPRTGAAVVWDRWPSWYRCAGRQWVRTWWKGSAPTTITLLEAQNGLAQRDVGVALSSAPSTSAASARRVVRATKCAPARWPSRRTRAASQASPDLAAVVREADREGIQTCTPRRAPGRCRRAASGRPGHGADEQRRVGRVVRVRAERHVGQVGRVDGDDHLRVVDGRASPEPRAARCPRAPRPACPRSHRPATPRGPSPSTQSMSAEGDAASGGSPGVRGARRRDRLVELSTPSARASRLHLPAAVGPGAGAAHGPAQLTARQVRTGPACTAARRRPSRWAPPWPRPSELGPEASGLRTAALVVSRPRPAGTGGRQSSPRGEEFRRGAGSSLG